MTDATSTVPGTNDSEPEQRLPSKITIPETHLEQAIHLSANFTRANFEPCLATDEVTVTDGELTMTLSMALVEYDHLHRNGGTCWLCGRLFISPVTFIDLKAESDESESTGQWEFLDEVNIDGTLIDIEYTTSEPPVTDVEEIHRAHAISQEVQKNR